MSILHRMGLLKGHWLLAHYIAWDREGLLKVDQLLTVYMGWHWEGLLARLPQVD